MSSRVTGGELFEDIVAREYYSEADARSVCWCVWLCWIHVMWNPLCVSTGRQKKANHAFCRVKKVAVSYCCNTAGTYCSTAVKRCFNASDLFKQLNFGLWFAFFFPWQTALEFSLLFSSFWFWISLDSLQPRRLQCSSNTVIMRLSSAVCLFLNIRGQLTWACLDIWSWRCFEQVTAYGQSRQVQVLLHWWSQFNCSFGMSQDVWIFNLTG